MAGVLAALLICSIIGISNGDTLRARCAIEGTPQTITVRLAEVDAPEKAQSFGARSKQNLSALCFRKAAQVRPVSLDRYARTVAHVSCNGHDASAEQVRAGMAGQRQAAWPVATSILASWPGMDVAV